VPAHHRLITQLVATSKAIYYSSAALPEEFSITQRGQWTYPYFVNDIISVDHTDIRAVSRLSSLIILCSKCHPASRNAHATADRRGLGL